MALGRSRECSSRHSCKDRHSEENNNHVTRSLVFNNTKWHNLTYHDAWVPPLAVLSAKVLQTRLARVVPMQIPAFRPVLTGRLLLALVHVDLACQASESRALAVAGEGADTVQAAAAVDARLRSALVNLLVTTLASEAGWTDALVGLKTQIDIK